MKRIPFHIKIIGLLLSVCSGLSSCIYDEGLPDDPHSVPPDLLVSFRLVMQHAEYQAAAASRGATPADDGTGKWSDDYDMSDAVSFESQLLKDRFFVTFYDAADNRYLGRLDYVTCTGLMQSTDGDVYEFRGVLLLQDEDTTVEAMSAMTVKMMITANTSGLSEPAFADVSAVDWGPGALLFSKIGQENDFDAIPMWGVSQRRMAGIRQGEIFDMGEIGLLRAMAKVEVCVEPGIAQEKGVAVQSVAISRANTSGYVLPGKWNTLAETSGLKFSETLRIPADAASGERTFGRVVDNAVVFYLPECANTGDEIVLTVNYTVGTETDSREGRIYFRPYDADGKPAASPLWDIVRNYHYRYEIVDVDMTASELIVKSIRIEDWVDDGGGILTPVQ